MNDATDTDASSGFTIGTGPTEQRGPNIHEINPTWLGDGHGIRGPQRQRVEETRAQPFEIPLAPDNNPKSSDASSKHELTVTDGTTIVKNVTKISFDGSVFDVVDSGSGEAHIQCAT